MLEVRDPADVRSVVAEVRAMTATEVAAAYFRARAAFAAWRRVNPLDRAAGLDPRPPGLAFKEQGSPGIRFYTRIKTTATRFAW